jgi:beta-phosphoglucomutase-like phosphatase (HAD superfamily)
VKDSFESHVWSVGEMMKVFGGIPITSEELKKKLACSRIWIFGICIFLIWKLNTKIKFIMRLLRETDNQKTYAYPGIVELIKKLKNKWMFFGTVVSSDSSKNSFAGNKRMEFGKYFDEHNNGRSR